MNLQFNVNRFIFLLSLFKYALYLNRPQYLYEVTGIIVQYNYCTFCLKFPKYHPLKPMFSYHHKLLLKLFFTSILWFWFFWYIRKEPEKRKTLTLICPWKTLQGGCSLNIKKTYMIVPHEQFFLSRKESSICLSSPTFFTIWFSFIWFDD